MTPNTRGQPNEEVIGPISSANITVAKYSAELKIARAGPNAEQMAPIRAGFRSRSLLMTGPAIEMAALSG
nr:hypothetical protein [uncultured Rhodopila sp.]